MAMLKRSLYSIDDVVAKKRFSSAVRISVLSTGLQPSVAEPDLSGWRPEHEREDRAEIIEAASRFVDDMKVSCDSDLSETYKVLIDLAPNYLKEFTRRDGLSVNRYYREAFGRVGDVRSDRPTVPLVGSLFTRENFRRLVEVAKYGKRTVMKLPEVCIWFSPQVPNWGMTSVLPDILGHLKTNALAISEDDENIIRTIGMFPGRNVPRHIKTAFDTVGTSHNPRISPSLEILLVPGILLAITVNAPIGVTSGQSVPLGFVSFDVQVIVRAHNFVREYIEDYAFSEDFVKRIRDAIPVDPLVLPANK